MPNSIRQQSADAAPNGEDGESYSTGVGIIEESACCRLCRPRQKRHTAITKLAEAQASEQTIQAIAGHLSPKMIERYSHVRSAAKRRALDAIAEPTFATDGAQKWAQSTNPDSASGVN